MKSGLETPQDWKDQLGNKKSEILAANPENLGAPKKKEGGEEKARNSKSRTRKSSKAPIEQPENSADQNDEKSQIGFKMAGEKEERRTKEKEWVNKIKSKPEQRAKKKRGAKLITADTDTGTSTESLEKEEGFSERTKVKAAHINFVNKGKKEIRDVLIHRSTGTQTRIKTDKVVETGQMTEEDRNIVRKHYPENYKKAPKGERQPRKNIPYTKETYSVSQGANEALKTKRQEKKRDIERIVDDWVKSKFPEYQTSIDSKELGNILKKYAEQGKPIENIVVHGQERIDSNGEIIIDKHGDIDTEMALLMLKEAGLTFKNLHYVKKGESIPGALHIDTGGAYAVLLTEKEGKKTAFVDHHGASKGFPTSATLHMYNLLVEAGLLKITPENEYLFKIAKFVTDTDNLSYINNRSRKYRSYARAEKTGNIKRDDINDEGEYGIDKNEPIFDIRFFHKEWWKTPYGVAKMVPSEFLAERFKKGIPPYQPFSEEEMESEFMTPKKGMQKLRTICMGVSKNIELSEKFMREKSKDYKSLLLGKTLVNLSRIENNKEQDRMPIMGETAYMHGYDTYVLWNNDSKRFFVSSRRDLKRIYNDYVKKIFPDPTSRLIRGVMIVSPLGEDRSKKYRAVDTNDFLKLLHVIDATDEKLGHAKKRSEHYQKKIAIIEKILNERKNQTK